MDAKGYMCFQDVEVWEEVDDIKPARKAPAKSAGAKQSAMEKKAASGAAQTQKKGGAKV